MRILAHPLLFLAPLALALLRAEPNMPAAPEPVPVCSLHSMDARNADPAQPCLLPADATLDQQQEARTQLMGRLEAHVVAPGTGCGYCEKDVSAGLMADTPAAGRLWPSDKGA